MLKPKISPGRYGNCGVVTAPENNHRQAIVSV